MPPQSTAAATLERDLFADVRSLLVGQGCCDPVVLRAERVSDCEVQALFTVPALSGRRLARSAFIADTGEVVIVEGFQA